MIRIASAAALATLLASAPSFAQTPAPAPATQKPPAPAPAAPAAPAPAPAAAQAPRPFPEGSKVAYIVLQRVAQESSEGKAASAKVQALNQKKLAELGDRQKQAQALQEKMDKGGAVMSEAARADLTKQLERLNVDLQRATQDAQQEVQELQQRLQEEFQQRLLPIIEQVAREKNLHFIFNGPDSGLVWADTGLDITTDVVRKLDAATKPAGQ
jgi:outer membrane protein